MLALSIVACICALAAIVLCLKRDLTMLQQNSYRPERYARWRSETGDSTAIWRLVGWIVFFACMVPAIKVPIGLSLIIAFSVGVVVLLSQMKYKLPLVFTPRARRIFFTALTLCLIVAAIAAFLFAMHEDACLRLFAAAIALVLCVSASSVAISFALWLLKPIEKRINQKYYDEAASILHSMPDLKIVGITGSFGKTSTKNYLTRMLAEKYDVLMTPGNFNTTLGVVRTVREYMKPYTEVFVCEMGAKQPGDIKEICELVHPTIGIVTAVGPMHLETFKSIENVQSTKFELIDSLPSDGLAVVNNDFEYIENRPVDNVECKRYGINNPAATNYYADNIVYSPQGTSFVIKNSEGTDILELQTTLVGSCNVSNLIGAAIVALYLGVEPDKIRYAVSKIEQVEHRLSFKRVPGGINVIDDAYNSNPTGAKMALEVLSSMTGGQRIIITPGMIELGEEQYDLNKTFGKEISKSADLAIIVGEYNRDAILEGLTEGGMPEHKVIAVDTLQEAQAVLYENGRSGDTVLYENDLPDTFK